LFHLEGCSVGWKKKGGATTQSGLRILGRKKWWIRSRAKITTQDEPYSANEPGASRREKRSKGETDVEGPNTIIRMGEEGKETPVKSKPIDYTEAVGNRRKNVRNLDKKTSRTVKIRGEPCDGKKSGQT